jgi:hypothetical protein
MRPCVRAIQASTGLVFTESLQWLLCRLVNGSARKPTKDVPSCDTLEGPAGKGRTRDFRMGIPTAIASRNGKRPELKHLSRGRKRKRNVMSSVTAGERDTAQTEALTGNVVCGLTCSTRTPSRSPLEWGAKQGESPVPTRSTVCVSTGVARVGNPL